MKITFHYKLTGFIKKKKSYRELNGSLTLQFEYSQIFLDHIQGNAKLDSNNEDCLYLDGDQPFDYKNRDPCEDVKNTISDRYSFIMNMDGIPRDVHILSGSPELWKPTRLSPY